MATRPAHQFYLFISLVVETDDVVAARPTVLVEVHRHTGAT